VVALDADIDRAACAALQERRLGLPRSGKYSAAADLGEDLALFAEEAFGPGSPVYAMFLYDLGKVYSQLGDHRKVEALYRQAAAIRRAWGRLGGTNDELYLDIIKDLRTLYARTNQNDKADDLGANPPLRAPGRPWREAMPDPDAARHQTEVASWRALAAYASGLNADALRIADRVTQRMLDVAPRVFGVKSEEHGTALVYRGGVLVRLGKEPEAEPLYKQAMGIGSEGNLHYLPFITSLAELYRSMGDHAKAESLCRRAVEIARRNVGEGHPDYARSLKALGLLYREMGEVAKAEPFYEQAERIQREALGERHPEPVETVSNLAKLPRDGTTPPAIALGAHPPRVAPPPAARSPAQEAALRGREAPESAAPAMATDTERDQKRCAALYEKVMDLCRARKLPELIETGNELVKCSNTAFGSQSSQHAKYLTDLAALYYSMGERTKAAQLFDLALTIWRATPERHDPGFAQHLNTVAAGYEMMGGPDEARELRQAAQGILRASDTAEPNKVSAGPTVGADSQKRWLTLYDRSVEVYKAGDKVGAIRIGDELAELTDVAFPPGDPARLACLKEVGALFIRLGKYEKAEPVCRKAVQTARSTLRDNDPEFIFALDMFAAVCMVTNRPEEAELVLLDAANARQKALGEDRPDYAENLHRLAVARVGMGRYAEAEAPLRRALEIREKILGPEHPDYIHSLGMMSRVYAEMGRYSEAEAILKRSRELALRALGPEHPDYARILEAQGVLRCLMGEHVEAEAVLSEALDIQRKALGNEHPDYAETLGALALSYVQGEQYDKAEPLFKEALQIAAKALGENHPEYARDLNDLATVHYFMQRHAEAERELEECLRIQKRVLGEAHPACADTLSNLAALHYRTGDRADVESRLRSVLEIRRNALGEQHPAYAQTCIDLATVYAGKEDVQKGLQNFDAGLAALHRHAVGVLSGLEEGRQVQFLQWAWPNVERHLSFVRQHAGAAGAAKSGAEWTARWKGLAAEVQADRFRMLRFSKEPESRRLVEELAVGRRELARLTLSPPIGMTAEELRRAREDTEKRVGELSTVLAERGSGFADLRRAGEVTLDQVAQALPQDGVLVDFAHFFEFNFNAGPNESQYAGFRYVAFITAAGQAAQPVMVDLGPAQPIDAAVYMFRSVLTKAEAGQRPLEWDGVLNISDVGIREIADRALMVQAIRNLGDLVLKPIWPYVKDKAHLVICPDGQLALVPFEAFLVGEEYLVETKQVNYLSSGREAVTLRRTGTALAASSQPVLVGNPDFDLAPTARAEVLKQTGAPATAVGLRGVASARQLPGGLFSPLPGTAAEVQRAAELIGGAKLLGAHALEETVKGVSGPDVLYLATHGFFLPDTDWVLRDRSPFGALTMRAVGGSREAGASSLNELCQRVENPLLRCGLALAGANRRESSPTGLSIDDGILTGLEVTGLDLRGTRLVVLSACQTGLGDVKQGEGVIGLRRAFVMAGAPRVLTTLWMVPDQQTQALMEVFIEGWHTGMPASHALRAAQLAMIARLRKEKGTAHPFYWAAFTLTGDWE
jgi:CHAT domain-containing protein/tetratricopeptide (TPR) repeat protein